MSDKEQEEDYLKQQEENMQFYEQLKQPVTITAEEIANKIHQTMYGAGEEHKMIHSCPCDHLALFYLGIRTKTGLYWPKEDGSGNKWKV